MDSRKQKHVQPYYSQKGRAHAHTHTQFKESGEDWQRGHHHHHGNRQHSDASQHIIEYICRPRPAAVYVTTGIVGFFALLVLS